MIGFNITHPKCTLKKDEHINISKVFVISYMFKKTLHKTFKSKKDMCESM